MPEYTVAAVLAVVAVVLLERRRRTGLFRSPSYWSTMAIALFFMVLVNGWLTKLSAPVVRYDPDARTLGRFPWDIPVEDFLYGFALLTWVLLRWKADDRPDGPPMPDPTSGNRSTAGRSRSPGRVSEL